MKRLVKSGILFFTISLAFASCQKEDKIPSVDSDGLTKDVHNIIPDDILQDFKNLGIQINGGDTPPNIEGTYLVSPLILIKSNFADSYLPGFQFADMELTFSKQDNSKLTVVCDYDLTDGTESGTGLGSFITGSGNKFSVFEESSGTLNGYPFKSVNIYSGEISSSGIINFYKALMVTEEAPTTIQRGQGRLVYDSDGVSEKFSSTNKSSANHVQGVTITSSKATLPSLLSK